jgi:hypothetical protein
MINYHSLVGKIIEDKWTVVTYLEKEADDTGGFFSKGYIVKGPNEQYAFFKAIFTEIGRAHV